MIVLTEEEVTMLHHGQRGTVVGLVRLRLGLGLQEAANLVREEIVLKSMIPSGC